MSKQIITEIVQYDISTQYDISKFCRSNILSYFYFYDVKKKYTYLNEISTIFFYKCFYKVKNKEKKVFNYRPKVVLVIFHPPTFSR